MQVSIIPASENKLPDILEIYNDAIINTTAVYDYTPHSLAMRQAWFEDKQRRDIPVLVAMAQQQVAGFASWGPFRPWAAYKYTVEHSVYVHPRFRQLGIAKQLLAELIKQAEQKQVHCMIGGIDADNTVSIHLHRQFGFESAGQLNQVGYKFGKWLNLVFMQKVLESSFIPNET